MLRGWVGADHLLDDEVVAAIRELRDGTLSAYAFEDAFICGKFSEQDLSDEGNAFTRYYYLSSDSAVSDAYLLRRTSATSKPSPPSSMSRTTPGSPQVVLDRRRRRVGGGVAER